MAPLQLPPQHLATHSGKTGLLMMMVEEALPSQVPVLMIDVKGDLPNLLLAFPFVEAERFVPWVEGQGIWTEAEVRARAQALASEREQQLAGWNITPAELAAFNTGIHLRALTPGSSAGEPLHMLSALERDPCSDASEPTASPSSTRSAHALQAAAQQLRSCRQALA